MIRIFVSFYLFIVVALVSLSALLDNMIASQDNDTPHLEMLAHSIAIIRHQSQVDELSKHPALYVDVINSAEMSFSTSQSAMLQKQGFIITYNEHDQPFIYSQLNPHELLRVGVEQNLNPGEDVLWYRIAFFTALALLVALWSWPIWRDIKKLEKGARSVQPDGSIRPIQVGASSSLNVVATALQSLSQQVRDLLNNQRELTSAVAHEFRTPLARLKFALASLKDSEEKASMGEDVTELERLIQEMLEFSQSEHHEPELSFAEIPVRDMVSSLIDSLPKNKRADIHIDNHCGALLLHADGHFAERAVFNLINNALKYATSSITISTEKHPGKITIAVEDDGPGVPEDLRDKIFDAFYRPDKSRARHKGGAGLGLATVKKIQHWHQGDCWVEQSPSGGARFVLSYPAD